MSAASISGNRLCDARVYGNLNNEVHLTGEQRIKRRPKLREQTNLRFAQAVKLQVSIGYPLVIAAHWAERREKQHVTTACGSPNGMTITEGAVSCLVAAAIVARGVSSERLTVASFTDVAHCCTERVTCCNRSRSSLPVTA